MLTVTLFHPSVDFEERGIVGCTFHPRHDAGFVIEFDAGRPHLVADTCTLDTGAEIITDLTLISSSVQAIQEVFNRFAEMNKQTKTLSGVVNEKAELSDELKQYQELGTVEEVTTALDIAEKLMTNAEETVADAARITEEFGDLGTPEEIAAALDLLEAYANTATPAELAEATDLLEGYVALGTLSEVEALIERTEQLAESLLEQKQQAQIKEIAEETGAPMDVVGKMLESFDAAETRDMLGRINGQVSEADAEPAAAEPAVEADVEAEANVDEAEAADVAGEDQDELDEGYVPVAQRSRAGSLTESLMAQFSSVTEDSVELSESEAPVRNSTVGLFANCE